MSTVAERLAGFTSTLSADALPPEVAVAAKLHVLDTLGCGLAAFAVGVASGRGTRCSSRAPRGPRPPSARRTGCRAPTRRSTTP